MRTWIVAFWTFVAARNADDVLLGPIAVSVIVTVLSLPASILGNEAALRFGRHRAVTVDHDRFGAGRANDRPQRIVVTADRTPACRCSTASPFRPTPAR